MDCKREHVDSSWRDIFNDLAEGDIIGKPIQVEGSKIDRSVPFL